MPTIFSSLQISSAFSRRDDDDDDSNPEAKKTTPPEALDGGLGADSAVMGDVSRLCSGRDAFATRLILDPDPEKRMPSGQSHQWPGSPKERACSTKVLLPSASASALFFRRCPDLVRPSPVLPIPVTVVDDDDADADVARETWCACKPQKKQSASHLCGRLTSPPSPKGPKGAMPRNDDGLHAPPPSQTGMACFRGPDRLTKNAS
ncbi:hypothetical protein LX36DRAFT_675053 [Colletotrichum falcatum]|nr:hypothetical protein LX36DRAFT_675053 [Colletotrichum falcatum]